MAFVWKHGEAISRQLIPDPPVPVPFQAWLAGEGEYGSFTVVPAKPTPQGGIARRPQAQTAFEFMQNSIFFVPQVPTFYMGLSAAEAKYQLRIWNTFRREVTYNYSEIETKGVYLTPLDGSNIRDPLPYHSIRDYEITATVNTDVNIEAIFRFEWDAGWTNDVRLYGSRVVLWRYPATNNVNEGLSWYTTVAKTKKSEERYAHLFNPRETLDYNFFLTREQLSEMKILYGAWRYNKFAVPYWMESVKCGYFNTGATTISMDTTSSRFNVGTIVCFIQGEKNFASIITELTPTNIVIDPPADQEFTSALGIPCFSGRLEGSLTAVQSNTELYKVQASFLNLEAEWVENQPYPLYQNVPVFLERPLDNGTEIEEFPVNVIDYDIGVQDVLPEFDFNVVRKSFTYPICDQEDANTYRGFLNYLKGQYRAVWVPDWSATFELEIGKTAQDTQIEVTPNFMERYETIKYIMVETKDGTRDYFEILTTSIVAGRLVLQLDRELGFELPLEDINLITRINHMRLEADGVEISYNQKHQGRLTLNFTTAPEFPS